MVTVAVLGTACTTPPPPPEPTGPDPELLAMLEDPEFVAQLGETDEEREQILADIRRAIEEEADGEWVVDPEARERWTAEKEAADAEQAAQDRLEAERLEAEAAAERRRLDELQAGPSVEDIAAAQGDGSESYDYSTDAQHWKDLPGWSEAVAQMTADTDRITKEVATVVERLRAEGTLEQYDAIPGWVPPEGEDDAKWASIWLEQREIRIRPPATGACKNRDSARKAPADPALRPGTIYTPYQNTHADPSGTPTHVGQLRTAIIGGQRHMVVEGHLGDLDVAGFLPHLQIQTEARVHLTLHHAGNLTQYDGIGPYRQVAVPGEPVQSGQVQVLCYVEDLGLPTGEPIRRAMFRAYLPMAPDGVPLPEPAFQVKATVSENNWSPSFFFGADMRTVYLGQEPLAYNETFTGGGFGVSAGSGIIVDNNSYTGDDIESSITPRVRTAITNGLTSIEGQSDWVWGKKGGNWGWFGFHVNNSAPTTPTVDIDWNQTHRSNGAADDEFRLKGTVSMNDWLIEGYTSVPFALLGLVPCYARMKVDFTAEIYASVDINDTARTILVPDIRTGTVDADVHSMFVTPLPLGCNFLYTFLFVNRWIEKITDKVDHAELEMADEVGDLPNVQNAVPATVPIGGGQNMQTLFAGWNDTCAPYSCDGVGAGDMAMGWAGLEASGDIRFTDTKPVSDPRRFPVSHSPTTAGTASDRVRDHFDPQNEIIDAAAWVNPAVLNQALRVLGEHGRLDLPLDPSTPATARSAPVYLSTPIAPDKPLGLFVPHLEVDDVPGGNIFALDIALAVGVGFDSGTRKLVPAPVSPTDPGLAFTAWTLKCSSTLWAVCTGVPNFVSTAGTWVANTVLNPVLQNTIGEITVPNTAGFNLTNVRIVNEDGHLGLRASIGQRQLRVWGGINASTYDFHTFWEGLPGTGPVTFQWTIKDNISGAVIFTDTSQQWEHGGFSTSALTPLTLIGPDIRSVTATITASRGGQSITGSHTQNWFG